MYKAVLRGFSPPEEGQPVHKPLEQPLAFMVNLDVVIFKFAY